MLGKVLGDCAVSEIRKTSIVIVGSGAIGLLYGCRLLEAEQNVPASNTDVNFICRRDFIYCSSHGFRMESPDGNYYSGKGVSMARKVHRDSSTITIPREGVDWIICAVKSYSLQGSEGESLKSMIMPMIGENTRMLLIMNGLGCEEVFCDWFGRKNVFVGMAFTCVNRNNPNVLSLDLHASADDQFVLINHTAFGALSIGHCDDDGEELEVARALWSHTKIAAKVTVATSLLHAQWSKLCWNLPFSGLCVAMGGITTDILANDPDLRFMADQIMLETLSLGNEDILLHHEASLLAAETTGRTPVLKLLNADEIRPYCWALTDRMGPYKSSTVLDLIRDSDLELQYIFNQPLERAKIITMWRRAERALADSVDGSSSMLNRGKKEEAAVEKTDWTNLENVVRQVNAISRIANERRKRHKSWEPAFVLDIGL